MQQILLAVGLLGGTQHVAASDLHLPPLLISFAAGNPGELAAGQLQHNARRGIQSSMA
jgi:hypothetical protein